MICPLYTSGTSQRIEKACSEPEDQEKDTLDTVVDGKTLREIIPTLPFAFQFNRNLKPEDLKDLDQALQLHQLLKRSLPMEHGQQEVQPSIKLGRTWSKFPEDMSQIDNLQESYGNHQRMESQQEVQTPGREGNQDKGKSSHYPSYRRTTEPDRAYYDYFRLTRSRPNQISSGFKPFMQQKISGQESLFFTITDSFQEKTRIQREKKDLFQPQAEKFRPNVSEAVGLGERSTQEPEIVVNTSRISSPINKNISLTQNEHNVVTHESNLNSNQLWLKMSQFQVKTQEKFEKLHRSNERLKRLKTLHEATIKAIQESCAKL
ncbi:hypothetical protein O181_089085 [Austropuccinia psidii MF-1]|uniref:Uncharacterized protein n=1 Tax=Austropuccinia psidii MF-1 TaxID=1389203 RepID=A0A9Q3IT47_9BASI|nr:hypothetical protein [Austropuccinia psidii MF-1]